MRLPGLPDTEEWSTAVLTQGEILEIGHTFSGCCVHAK